MKLSFFCLCLLFVTSVPAQNLMEERIWKVASRKKAIYLDSGVFHHNASIKNSSITAIRNSAVNGRGYERVVIDFNSSSIPKIYGHITPEKKISIDLFDTTVMTSQPQMKNSKFVRSLDFISVDGKTITMEMTLKGKSTFDIFYLENPGRLVIDIR